MITYEKLSLYAQYNGSNDLFIKMASAEERKILTRDDWIMLYRFEDFYCPADGTQPTAHQIGDFERDMLACCADATVFSYVKQVVERQCQDSRKMPLLKRIASWLLECVDSYRSQSRAASR
ncbi:MAG: hypothetical protein EOO61_19090, partial [Hymenobacter sp.]